MDLQVRKKCAKSLRPFLVALVLLISLCLGLSAALAEVKIMPKISPQQKIEGRYIVVLRDSVPDPEAFAGRMSKQHRLKLRHVYRRALKGFAAQIPESILPWLKRHTDVAFIEPDRIVYALSQTLPSGVDRIQADQNDTHKNNPVDVDIAIIDTGIDLDHPDLNVVASVNCARFFGGCADGGDDGHGHGSHVAGISAAIDNDEGVIGVAPGARLWAVRVLDNNGSGMLSWILNGIEWVIEHADDIEVANMSLGFQGTSEALRDAIRTSVDKGVVYVAAAGNDGQDVYGNDGTFGTTDDFSPAAFPEVATISAFGDSDGQPGGLGPDTSYSTDDAFASFSNYSQSVVADNPVASPGAAIDLLCPGVDIYSANKNGGYTTFSGTSMASPHAAGLAALYIAANGRATNAAGVYRIRQALIDAGIDQDSDSGLADDNDPDSNWENIGWAERSEPVENDLAVTAVDAPQTVVAGEETEITVTFKTLGTNDADRFTVTLTDGDNGPQIGSSTVEKLPAGETARLVFAWRPDETDIGDHTLVASHDFSDDNRANDSKSASVVVISDDIPASLHIGDLDGSGSATNWWFVWRATVDIMIQDNLNQPVAQAEVDIDWSDGSEDSCTTDSSGVCQMIGYQWIWSGSLTLSVVDVYHQDLTYDPNANEDPDGDSNGTSITVKRP